jgi:hypothetical protein
MHHHHVGAAGDCRYRRDVADELETEIVIERRVDRIRRADDDERIAVRARPCRRLGADRAAGARPVVNDEGLAEPLRQPLTDQTRENVEGAAGREANDDMDRPISLGVSGRTGSRSGARSAAFRYQLAAAA